MKYVDIDIDYAVNLLDYNPDTGLFYRITPIQGARVGDVAGCKSSSGHIQISIRGVKILAHRLAWAMHYGLQPKEIDHINGIKDDNRISNLRECTRSQNQANKNKQKNNTSGHKGVFWHKNHNKWTAQIKKNGKHIHLGVFINIDDAVQAYAKATKIHNSEFARTV